MNDKEITNRVKKNIRSLRDRERLSQAGLAEKTGIKRATINAWEQGAVLPKLSSLRSLASYFKIRPDDIFNMDLTTRLPDPDTHAKELADVQARLQQLEQENTLLKQLVDAQADQIKYLKLNPRSK